MNISPQSSKPVIAAAFGMLMAFFMPWVMVISTFPFSAYRLATQFTSDYYVWLIPLLAVATIWISLNGSNNRSIAAIAGIVSICTVEVLVGNVLENHDSLLFGAWFTILCSIVTIIASFINIPESGNQIQTDPSKKLPENVVWISFLIGGLIGAKIGSMMDYGLTGAVFGVLIAHSAPSFLRKHNA